MTMSTAPTLPHSHKHPYHLVDPSPWPIVGAAVAGVAVRRRGVVFMHGWPAVVHDRCGFLGVLGVMFVWWRDVITRGANTAAITRRWCRSACATAWRCSSPRR